jgi:signal transducing adaptor molecule
VAALQKRLAHRNPNVQLYALEVSYKQPFDLSAHAKLANTLAQNCSKPLLEELSSRPWTGALDRLINDRVCRPFNDETTLTRRQPLHQ